MTAADSWPRGLLLLLVGAALFSTANAHRLSLLPLDDCHYAQKGVEMAETGAWFTVTWAGEGNTQHAPLQFWILGRSFSLFGFNDFAARFPSALMGLGLVFMAWEIGRRTVGETAGLTGACLLLATNTVLQNLRRCMLEVPTAFWVTMFFLVFLWAGSRPRRLVWLSIPLAGAFLTKSVVGLVPIGILGLILLRRELRPAGWPWAVVGVALGLVLGATWTVHQGITQGWDTMEVHYFHEVGRVAAPSPWWEYPIAYPWITIRWFQPVAIPGLIGAIWVWRSDRWSPRARVLSLWVLGWLLIASFSSARYSRYVWPIVVPLALLAGAMVTVWSARLARTIRVAVPVLLILGGLIFWVRPELLTRDLNASFKASAPTLQPLLPRYTKVPLFGEYSRRLSNPLVYYAGFDIVAFDSPGEAAAFARGLTRPLVWVDRARRSEWDTLGLETRIVDSQHEWDLHELGDPGPLAD